MRTSRIFGYDFISDISYDALADQLIKEVNENTAGITNMITPNAHGINSYLRYPELNRFCRSSRYVLPDGQPIVWLSKFSNHKISGRLTGSDFFPVIFKKLLSPQHRCLFIVNEQPVADKLKLEKPDALFMIPPFFTMEETSRIQALGLEIAKLIKEHGISYVFIGISEPKQGALAKAATKVLKETSYERSCVFFFLGASYQFYLGMKKRAPALFRKTGMEWFYRLASEPRRMFKRYVFGNVSFMLKGLKWLINKNAFE